MRSPTSLKREFLKKWILALQLCNRTNKSKSSSTVTERKKTIKLSAEIAMATARNGATCWSRAIIANAAKSEEAKPFLSLLVGTQQQQQCAASSGAGRPKKKRMVTTRCKKIVKRSCRRRSINVVAAAAPEKVAKWMAKRRRKKSTEVLKRIVPGGELIGDDVALILETLDYMVSLRAQVQVMRCLVRAAAGSGFQDIV